MESRGPVSVDGIPDLSECDPDFSDALRDELTKLLQVISSGNIREYINDDELIRDDGCGRSCHLEVEKLPEGLSISGTSLYNEDDHILDFDYSLDGDSAPIEFADGSVTVPVEFIDEDNHEYEISMGELGALKSLAQKADCLPSDWPARLAALLIP